MQVSHEQERSPATATPPHFKVPAGACDCHFHLYDFSPQYEFMPNRPMIPPDAPLSALRAMHRIIGVQRGVFVHTGSAVYKDNSLLIDCLKADSDLRGIAYATAEMAENGAGLRELTQTGAVRGLRVSLRNLTTADGDKKLEMLERIAARIAPLGWHVQLHVPGALVAELAPLIRKLPVSTVVLDHMGRLTPAMGPDGKEFKALAELIQTGRVWVKLSAMFRNSQQGPPYEDLVPLGKALVSVGAQRCVWGTDWPFNHYTGPPPDAGTLLDCLAAWAPDEATRNRILVDNPKELYGF